jgi:hypothetical protein
MLTLPTSAAFVFFASYDFDDAQSTMQKAISAALQNRIWQEERGTLGQTQHFSPVKVLICSRGSFEFFMTF